MSSRPGHGYPHAGHVEGDGDDEGGAMGGLGIHDPLAPPPEEEYPPPYAHPHAHANAHPASPHGGGGGGASYDHDDPHEPVDVHRHVHSAQAHDIDAAARGAALPFYSGLC